MRKTFWNQVLAEFEESTNCSSYICSNSETFKTAWAKDLSWHSIIKTAKKFIKDTKQSGVEIGITVLFIFDEDWSVYYKREFRRKFLKWAASR